jgi:hypothetical protein
MFFLHQIITFGFFIRGVPSHEIIGIITVNKPLPAAAVCLQFTAHNRVPHTLGSLEAQILCCFRR